MTLMEYRKVTHGRRKEKSEGGRKTSRRKIRLKMYTA
jgi:hypothetical protein